MPVEIHHTLTLNRDNLASSLVLKFADVNLYNDPERPRAEDEMLVLLAT
jgi:hypothetical protein